MEKNCQELLVGVDFICYVQDDGQTIRPTTKNERCGVLVVKVDSPN